MLAKLVASEQPGHEVGRDRLAPLVDEDRAIGIAVEGDAEGGAGRFTASITSRRFSTLSGSAS